MSNDIFFFIGYIFLILILFIIPITKTIFINNKSELLSITSIYLFLLADIKSDSNNNIIFNIKWNEINGFLVSLGVIFILSAAIFNFYDKKKFSHYKKLENELNKTKAKLDKIKEEYYKLCSDNIRIIFHNFFQQTDGQGRVSIYKYEENSFKIIGRYSNNPVYNNIGRGFYPENEGFIAKGWELGIFSISDAPKWVSNGRDYKQFMKEVCNISEASLKNIRMKSRSFFIYRINNEDSRPPLGIIVFEQIKPSSIEEDITVNSVKSHEAQLQFLIKSMKSFSNN